MAAGAGGVAGLAGLAGQGGLAGAGGMAGGGAAGEGGAGAEDDRCDVAVYDAEAPPAALTLSGNLGTHDPVVIEAGSRFYLFATGDNLGAKTSTDLESWQAVPEVFTNATRPDWLAERVPGVANLWAPDISYFGGSYHLYYSASTFGSNRSCIGHLTRAALDSGSWTDRGPVICSNASGANDDWNAIDPNVVLDRDGKAWLSFGSFWSGLKMFELDADGARVGTTLHSIASRPNNGGAVEAPFIVRRCGYYYLFVSFDSCCRGADSTYNQRVGRSASVTGPYVDKNGTPMLEGGGTPLLAGGSRWKGPGHNAVIFSGKAAYNVYHAYDANNGNPMLRIAELAWDADGWPVSGGP
jgi:arabinan endo-1,5-alpha-L-arabinosidase